jgi:hypothetical protein
MQDNIEENGTSCLLVSHISFGLITLVQGDPENFQPFFIRFPWLMLPGSSTLVPFHAIDAVVNNAMLKSEAGNKKRK